MASSRCPVTGARHLRSPPRRPAALPPALRVAGAGPRPVAAGSRSTASSTTVTCGSTAPTSATPRATSSPTRSTSPTRSASEPSTSSAIEVTCTRPSDRTAKRNITGVFQHWDCLDPDWNPGGIWRPVRVERHRAGAHQPAARAVPRGHRRARPSSAFSAELDADDGPTVTSAHDGRRHRPRGRAAAGRGREPGRVDRHGRRPRAVVAPRARRQPLHDVGVAVLAIDPGTRAADVSDRKALRIGLRQVRMHNWICRSTASACSSRARTRARRAWRWPRPHPRSCGATCAWRSDAGLDLLRIHAHVTRPELYDAADEAGLLLWQDMPLQWGYARGDPQAGRPPGARGRRSARPPPVDRPLVRSQRADRDRTSSGPRVADEVAFDVAGRRSCRRGTRPSSTAR